mmetsp:Transcript_45621/g.113321  ORF Transcript_45621/g.113321 Transcript_45621/m.113321 type:complete len:373 (-) Transcript_45621:385-1503(-)
MALHPRAIPEAEVHHAPGDRALELDLGVHLPELLGRVVVLLDFVVAAEGDVHPLAKHVHNHALQVDQRPADDGWFRRCGLALSPAELREHRGVHLEQGDFHDGLPLWVGAVHGRMRRDGQEHPGAVEGQVVSRHHAEIPTRRPRCISPLCWGGLIDAEHSAGDPPAPRRQHPHRPAADLEVVQLRSPVIISEVVLGELQCPEVDLQVAAHLPGGLSAGQLGRRLGVCVDGSEVGMGVRRVEGRVGSHAHALGAHRLGGDVVHHAFLDRVLDLDEAVALRRLVPGAQGVLRPERDSEEFLGAVYVEGRLFVLGLLGVLLALLVLLVFGLDPLEHVGDGQAARQVAPLAQPPPVTRFLCLRVRRRCGSNRAHPR